jgi:hypothetical protein
MAMPCDEQCIDLERGMTCDVIAFVTGSRRPAPPSRAGWDAMNKEWSGRGCGGFSTLERKWWFAFVVDEVNGEVHFERVMWSMPRDQRPQIVKMSPPRSSL